MLFLLLLLIFFFSLFVANAILRLLCFLLMLFWFLIGFNTYGVVVFATGTASTVIEVRGVVMAVTDDVVVLIVVVGIHA